MGNSENKGEYEKTGHGRWYFCVLSKAIPHRLYMHIHDTNIYLTHTQTTGERKKRSEEKSASEMATYEYTNRVYYICMVAPSVCNVYQIHSIRFSHENFLRRFPALNLYFSSSAIPVNASVTYNCTKFVVYC